MISLPPIISFVGWAAVVAVVALHLAVRIKSDDLVPPMIKIEDYRPTDEHDRKD